MLITCSIENENRIETAHRETKLITATSESDPSKGGTLRIGMSYFIIPSSWNPYLDPIVALDRYPMFSCLLRYDENGEIISDLAESWEVSKNELNYTFYLYSNVKWHDGIEFNASDVEYTWEMIMTNPDVNTFWTNYLPLDRIDSINVMKATTIVFVLKQPYGPLLHYLTWVPIIPKHIYGGTKLTMNEANQEPIGTGPFEYADWQPDMNLTLSANKNYFRGSPSLDSLLYRYDIPIEKLADFLLNNTIDLVPENIDPNRLEEIQKIPGITIVTADQLAYHYIGFNLRNPILNYEFRRAVAHAINITRIIECSYLGYAKEAISPIPPILTQWHNPNVITYDYNEALAKEWLSKSGYSGETISIKVGDWDPLKTNASQIIKDYLEVISINVKLEYVTEEEFWDTIFVNHDFDLYIGGWEISEDPDDLYHSFHSDGFTNAWNYSNPTLDQLLEKGRNTTDYNQRKEIYDKAQEIITTDLVNVFTIHQTRINDHNNDFHGLLSTPSTRANSAYILENTYYEPVLSGKGKSPVKIAFIDSQNRITGWNPENGTYVTEIPNSEILEDQNTVKIRSSSGNYTLVVIGTDNGTYSLETISLSLDYKYFDPQQATIRENQTRLYYITVHENGSITVINTIPDLNEDDRVDLYDAVTLLFIYGSTPESSHWNLVADIAYPINKIDLYDAVALLIEYGKKWNSTYYPKPPF